MKLLRTLFTLLIVLAALAAGVLFALQNEQPVALDLLFFTFPPRSLALWILLAFALGGLAGMLASSLLMIRQRAALGASKRRLHKTQTEVGKLRDSGSKEVSAK